MSAVTVVMPVYNAMPYLPIAVKSVLSQRFSDFVFLVIDDGSTDGSREYLNGLNDSRIRLVQGEHCGLKQVLNRSLEIVGTRLYARMDADDIAMPDRLSTQCAFMDDHPEVVLSGTQINYLTGNRILAGPPLSTAHSEIVRDLVAGRPAIRHPACMMRTQTLCDIGGYRLKYSEDHDLFLRMSECGLLANIPKHLLTYRIHLSSTFARDLEQYLMYKDYAIRCYIARRHKQREPVLAEFMPLWKTQGVFRKNLRKVDAWSAFQYRSALIDLGDGRGANATFRMIAAAICRPSDSWKQATCRLKRIFTRMTKGR